jgi:hypothetical protein
MLAQTVRVAIDEAEAERRIRETFDQVEVWHRAPLFTPLLGAQLRADDDEWPHLALSQLAKAGLDVAAEHLFTIRTLVEAGQVLPIAFRSILRTALVGSTQAVWLLESDDLEERTRRHRVLVNEMYRRHGAYLKALLKSDDHSDVVAHENTIKLHTHITKRHSQIGTLRTFADETETWEDTRAIEQAARAAFIKDPNVDQLVLEARLEWMAGSGAAHGLVWPLFGTAGTRVLGPADKQGRAVIEAGGSYARVLNAYLLAYWMTAAGWKLLRRRGL